MGVPSELGAVAEGDVVDVEQDFKWPRHFFTGGQLIAAVGSPYGTSVH
ncbi:hypothetical protein [Streptomyces sp. PU-14G]